MRRAFGRGEIAAGADVLPGAEVTPSMGAYRTLLQGPPFDRDFIVPMIDG
jgi:hypothetical protein